MGFKGLRPRVCCALCSPPCVLRTDCALAVDSHLSGMSSPSDPKAHLTNLPQVLRFGVGLQGCRVCAPGLDLRGRFNSRRRWATASRRRGSCPRWPRPIVVIVDTHTTALNRYLWRSLA